MTVGQIDEEGKTFLGYYPQSSHCALIGAMTSILGHRPQSYRAKNDGPLEGPSISFFLHLESGGPTAEEIVTGLESRLSDWGTWQKERAETE